MNAEFINVLENIEKEKGISREVLIESIEAALISAAKRVLPNKEADVQVKIDPLTGQIRVYSDGKEQSSGEFGRIAAQTAKQVIFQKLRDAERDVVFSEFNGKADTITSGTVFRYDKGALLVDLGKTEAALPKRELSPRDNFRQGDMIRAYILEVNKSAKGPQVILSRCHPNFVKALFVLEVPEMSEGIVEIRSVSREAGDRTKIAVWSSDEKIDSVGAFVGIRGSRVKGVVRELQGEKIDIVRWSNDPSEFIKAALSPAEIISVDIIDANEKKAEVVVDDEQLSLAIGKNGQNVRLASRLTGWSIDIKSQKNLVGQKLEGVFAADSEEGGSTQEDNLNWQSRLDQVSGVGSKASSAFLEAGYQTLEDLKGCDISSLEIKGVGPKTLQKIQSIINELKSTANNGNE